MRSESLARIPTETVNYTYTSPSTCSIKAQCNTWGTPSDPWAGSSCNLFISTQSGMTKPTVLTLAVAGITQVTSAWGASATLTNGNLVMSLLDPVYTANVGFNANGVITLPTQATLATNGQVLTCPIVTSLSQTSQTKLKK